MNPIGDIRLVGATDGSGDATITGNAPIGSRLYAVEWIDGDLADGVDAVLSCQLTGSGVDQTLLTLTNANTDAWYYPRVATDDNAGAADGGTDYGVINGQLKLVIASGGDTKTGGAIVWYWK